jgi:undecaprenyl-diphosphatase
MIEILGTYDQALFIWLNSAGTPTWDPFWLVVTSKWSSIPLYLVLLWALKQYQNWRQVGQTLLVLALMILVTDQLANLFKYILVQRPRPCREVVLQDQIRMVAAYCGRYGYFSAHAASAAALTGFFIRLLKHQLVLAGDSAMPGVLSRSGVRYLIAFLGLWAAALGYSRIYLGVHYPLDVLTGWIVGGLLGGWAFYPLQRAVITRSS